MLCEFLVLGSSELQVWLTDVTDAYFKNHKAIATIAPAHYTFVLRVLQHPISSISGPSVHGIPCSLTCTACEPAIQISQRRKGVRTQVNTHKVAGIIPTSRIGVHVGDAGSVPPSKEVCATSAGVVDGVQRVGGAAERSRTIQECWLAIRRTFRLWEESREE